MNNWYRSETMSINIDVTDVCMEVVGNKCQNALKIEYGENGGWKKSVEKHEIFFDNFLKKIFFTGFNVKTWEIEIQKWKFHWKKIDYSCCETAETAL